MKSESFYKALRSAGTGIGVGILAGIAGTAAITLSQTIEMKITNRKARNGPVKAVEKTLNIHAQEGHTEQMNQQIHWVYGTSWGIVRGLLGITGLNKWVATLIHYTAITSTGMAMAPLEDEEPVSSWDAKTIALDLMHHAVYALAAGFVFDAIYKKNK